MYAWYHRRLLALFLASVLFPVNAASPAEPRGKNPLPDDVLYRVGSRRFRIGQRALFLAFSKDGKTLLSINETKSFGSEFIVRCWDTTTGKQLRQFALEKTYGSGFALSPDGTRLAVLPDLTLNDIPRMIRIVDTANGRVIRSFAPQELGPRCIAFSPDGRTLATTDGKGTILLWDPVSGKSVGQWKGDPSQWLDLAFSPDGKRLARADDKSALRVWDRAAGRELYRFQAPKDSLISPQSAFIGDGEIILSRDIEGGQIGQLTFSPDGNKLVAVNAENNAVVWSISGPVAGRLPAALTAAQLAGLWSDLASEDGRVAFRAIRTLTAADSVAVVDFLRRHSKDIPHLDRRLLARRIAELDSDEFAVRERAAFELTELGILAEESMRKALQDHPTLEMRKRLEMLLEKQKGKPITAAIVRGWRAVEVLEHLATPEARKLLEEWAKDVPQAKEALKRLARRRKQGT